MSYPIQIREPSERQAFIEQAATLPDRSHEITLQGRRAFLPIKVAPLDLPIYRLENMRTTVLQLTHIHRNDLPANYFRDGQEDIGAQRAQHALLVTLSKHERKDIYRRLETTVEQREPIVVTDHGVVLNGNRRLAAMRELYAEDPGRYARFEHLEAAVLPAGTGEDVLIELETDLQILDDLKLEYGWVEKALGLKRQIEERAWPWEKAAQHWGEGEDALKRLLNRLALADEYLQRSEADGEYERVAVDEQAFVTLEQQQRTRRDAVGPERLEAERLLTFAELANKDATTGRLYDHIRMADQVLPRVLTDDTLTIPQSEAAPVGEDAVASGGSVDPLAALPEREDPVSAPSLDFLRDPDRWADIARAASEHATDVMEERDRATRGRQFSKDIERIHRLARGLSLTNANPATLRTATAELVHSLSELTQWLRQMTETHPEAADALDADQLAEVERGIKALIDRQS